MHTKTLLLALLIIAAGCDTITEEHDTQDLPDGYTLDSYTIEETMDTPCETDNDCETPMEYLVQSRCPFTAICLEGTCAVVCPESTMEYVQGIITAITYETDGSILTVQDEDETHNVLVSIPNLGEEQAATIQHIEVGKHIQAAGESITIGDETTIIARRLYVEGSFTEEHPCMLTPDPGTCEAAMPRYYYDQDTKRCEEFLWGGCDGIVPFDLLDVCQKTCEQGVPAAAPLTRARCQADGGHLTTTTCGDDMISIGTIEESDTISCCMPAGGTGTRT